MAVQSSEHTTSDNLIPDSIVEIQSATGTFLDFGVKPLLGSLAYRKYNPLLRVARTNVSGNFRGMILYPQMRAIYEMKIRLPVVGKIAGIEGLSLRFFWAGIIFDLTNDFSRIMKSDQKISGKLGALAFTVPAVCARALTSTVSAGAHAIAVPLLKTYGYFSGDSTLGLMASLKADEVDHTFRQVFDGQNWWDMAHTIFTAT
jgi:hypothetical protein